MTLQKQELLYEGKAKLVYSTTDENTVWIQYKNSATAFNGEKSRHHRQRPTEQRDYQLTIFHAHRSRDRKPLHRA